MIVVADAGPLMALGKAHGLGVLFHLFPSILTPPAVYEEVVIAGLRLGAPDALVLQEHYQSGKLSSQKPSLSTLPQPSPLGLGEEESILLAIERRADWLLVDDLDARKAAVANFGTAGVGTRVKGTLGVILSACQAGRIPREEAVRIVTTLGQRPDIWISPSLCMRVLTELKAG